MWNTNRILKTLRTLHSWLGIFVLPWIIVIGATGFYLNHARALLDWLGPQEFSEIGFVAHGSESPIDADRARHLAAGFWPDQPIKSVQEEIYHGRPSYVVKKAGGRIILSIPTGHHYQKSRYIRRTFAPDGTLLHTKVYWGAVFKDLHETGWLGGGMGTVLADLVALAMVFFGMTGAILWSVPKLRRRRRRAVAPKFG